MRRGPLFYLLMVVLVLRGLMGTAMAAGMVPMQHGPAPVVQAAPADHHGGHGQAATPATDHAQHTGHGAPEAASLACQGATSDGTGCATHSQHANCTACEICHSALLEPPALPAAPLPLAAGAAAAAATPFDSATAALAIKPPIAS
jgi:hypothetical protein